MKFEIGKYYKDRCYEDIILIDAIDGYKISFTLISDPNGEWQLTTIGSSLEWTYETLEAEEFELYKAYNTPLWKILNET